MNYILIEKIKIERPVIFLCGPYYNRKNPSDRRLILQTYIKDRFNNKFLPLVIDDFLIDKNIKDSNISIQLMEEICAAISVRTYIFLDTMSSATELGIFANSSFSNKITAFIPMRDDIYNRGNVGYFVKDIVLKDHDDQIETFEYHPRIDRKVIATDFVTEHYSFVANKLPENIISSISNDSTLQEPDIHILEIENSSNDTDKPFKIRFSIDGNHIYIHTSIRLLFYVTASIMHCLYKDNLNSHDPNFSKFDIDKIESMVQHSFERFISSKFLFSFDAIKNIEISTVLSTDSKNLIYHIIKFIHIYYLYTSLDGVYMMQKPLGSILKDTLSKTQINQILNLSIKDTELINDINQNKKKYFEEITIRKGKKNRKIVKYIDDNNGKKARKIHEKIAKQLMQKYTPNSASYAYQKNKNIKNCASMHITSKAFSKYDIKSFFNSISINRAGKAFMKIFNILDEQKDLVQTLLNSCFWNDELPLGLVLSPLISDMYLNSFDNVIANSITEAGMVYTRYADDILVSSPNTLSDEQYAFIDRLITNELKVCGLSVNKKKTQKINFNSHHSFVKYLGICIVNSESGNYLSVGKEYIYNTAKEYLLYRKENSDFESHRDNMDEIEADKISRELYYKKKEIIGKIGFIKQIEGTRGCDIFTTRLRKYYPEINPDAIE